MKIKNKIRIDKLLDQFQSYIKIAGKVASLIVHVRGKPRALDYVALAAAGLEVLSEIRSEAAKKSRPTTDGEDWLEANGWEQIHYTLAPTVYKNIRNAVLVDKEEIDVEINQELMKGTILGEQFRWPRCEGTPMNLFYKSDRYEETMGAVADSIWNHLGSNSVIYDTNGLKEMLPDGQDLFETSLVRLVHERVSKFMNVGSSRGILIDGIPGTGKSLATRMVLQKLGFRVLHVKLAVLDELFASTGDRPTVDTILRMLRPDAVVIDDIDRVSNGDQPELLGLLELAKKRCKLVLVTTNNKDKLLAPLLRPGRLDDHLEVPPLDREIVEKIVGEDEERILDIVAAWPISYIRDYAERKKALGVERARAELPELEKRYKICVEDQHDPKLKHVDSVMEKVG